MARALWLSSRAAGRAVPDGRCDEGELNREPVLEVSSQQLRTGLLLAVIANLIWGLAAVFWSETAWSARLTSSRTERCGVCRSALLALLCAGRLRTTLSLLRVPRILVWSALDAITRPQLGRFRLRGLCGRATDASLGYFMLPLLTVLVGKLAFDEVLGAAQRIAICLAISAVVIQLIAHGSLPWISLVVSTSFALYGAIRKKIEADTLQGLFIEMLCMAPFALTWLWMTDGAGLGQHGLKVDIFLLLGGIYTTAPLSHIAATDCCRSKSLV